MSQSAEPPSRTTANAKNNAIESKELAPPLNCIVEASKLQHVPRRTLALSDHNLQGTLMETPGAAAERGMKTLYFLARVILSFIRNRRKLFHLQHPRHVYGPQGLVPKLPSSFRYPNYPNKTNKPLGSRDWV